MDAELQRWRADTPAAEAGRIHLNNAGAALIPRPVVEAVLAHLKLECELGGYEAAESVGPEIARAYECIAALVGARAHNIAVVENATAAFAQALSAFDFRPGDTLVTTRNDYISNQLMYLSLMQRRGVRVVRAHDLPEGGVDPASVRDLILQHRPQLVTLTWIPASSGLVQPAEEIGRVCRGFGVPYLVDACQAVGQIDLQVELLHCDFLAATARKFLRGPRGVGFLYVSDAALAQQRFPLLVDMRGAQWIEADQFRLVDSAARFENWEFAYALLLGQGAAARYALDLGLPTIEQRVGDLAAYARQRLAGLEGVRVLDRGSRLCGIVTAEIGSHDAAEVMLRLREEAINVSQTRREFARLDLDEKQVRSAIRVSPHYYNTHREIDILISALEEFTVE